MNCDDCLQNLDRYVDRELTDGELAQVQRHMADCPPCEDLYELQVGYKRLVKHCCDQGEAPAALKTRLQQILF
ncbi:MAG: zf-HC2 domain-containing protein [Candidatus Dormibacteraeota bacterium]|nr:zf-HC2 domain-containing protein [Candidatus Dormibacteraeota bacterium]